MYYVLKFIHPIYKTSVFLAENADVEKICYLEHPTLDGTSNIKKAKKYKSENEVKKDIYNLKYYKREFLKVEMFPVKILDSSNKEDLNIISNLHKYLK